MYHHSNPKLLSHQWEKPVVMAPHPSGHDLWCEVTWSHLVMTLQDWSWHLQGLKVKYRGGGGCIMVNVSFLSLIRSWRKWWLWCLGIWSKPLFLSLPNPVQSTDRVGKVKRKLMQCKCFGLKFHPVTKQVSWKKQRKKLSTLHARIWPPCSGGG